MRRKPNQLIPLEVSIIEVATTLYKQGDGEFYGFQIAKEIEGSQKGTLVGFGTLYRALDRLVDMGYLSRRWEESSIAEKQSRPQRRLYKLTDKGLAYDGGGRITHNPVVKG
jgi:DNA-binding PadR family transcriptional regulator